MKIFESLMDDLNLDQRIVRYDREDKLGDLDKELIGQKWTSTVSSIKWLYHVICQDKIKMTTKVLFFKVSFHIFSEFT